MGKQQQAQHVSAPKRRGRRYLRWLGGMLAALLGLMLLGALYESAAEAADKRNYLPPGQLVDVGGYRLHLHCVGTGSPTVVIEAGWGDWSTSWGDRVQPEAARTTRVCTYDRAGMGWSEPGPLPRTAEQFAHELHTLLTNAGIAGPYVLVGHSQGGLTVRLFAHEYAAEVAGVVLIESMHPGQAKDTAPAALPASAHPSNLSILTLPARIGLVRLVAGPLGLNAGLSPEVANAYLARSVTPRYFQTYLLDEGAGMATSLAQAGAVTTFGDLPLIVLSRGLDHETDWQRMQAELPLLSSRSEHLFAEQSRHNVQLDQPEAAVAAIVKMVKQIRQQGVQ